LPELDRPSDLFQWLPFIALAGFWLAAFTILLIPFHRRKARRERPRLRVESFNKQLS
jgi:hypothetical protein